MIDPKTASDIAIWTAKKAWEHRKIIVAQTKDLAAWIKAKIKENNTKPKLEDIAERLQILEEAALKQSSIIEELSSHILNTDLVLKRYRIWLIAISVISAISIILNAINLLK